MAVAFCTTASVELASVVAAQPLVVLNEFVLQTKRRTVSVFGSDELEVKSTEAPGSAGELFVIELKTGLKLTMKGDELVALVPLVKVLLQRALTASSSQIHAYQLLL